MSADMIEQKLTELERRLERLEEKARPVAKGTWREAAGAMKDCDLVEEAFRLGAEWRAQANAEGK